MIKDAANRAIFNMWLVVGTLTFVNLYNLIYSIMLAAMTGTNCLPTYLDPEGAAFVT